MDVPVVKLLSCILFFSYGSLLSQPLSFEKSVKIHYAVLINQIDSGMYGENMAIKVGKKSVAKSICNYALANYEKTSSYTQSLDLLRDLMRSQFMRDYDSTLYRINKTIFKTMSQDYFILKPKHDP